MPPPSRTRTLSSDDWLRLHRELVPELFRCVSRRVGADRTLAEDLVQETWLRALEAWRKQDLPTDPSAWLRTTAFNLTRNHFRRAVPTQLDETKLSDSSSPGDSARERSSRVQRALASLDAAQAELLVARHFDGVGLAQLALAHRTSERAIEGRLHRARQALGEILRRSVPAGTAPERILAELLGDQP